MKSTKKSLLASVLLGCVLVLVATTAFSAEWKVPAQWKFLRFAGGSAAGSWTPTSAKISELINKQMKILRTPMPNQTKSTRRLQATRYA